MSQTGPNGFAQNGAIISQRKLFLMKSPEFKDIQKNRAKWIYANAAEKARVQRGPKQAQVDLHKTDALCVDGF